MTSPATKQLRAMQGALQQQLDQHANMRTQYAQCLVTSGHLTAMNFGAETMRALLAHADQLATLDEEARVADVAKLKAQLEKSAAEAPRIVAP